MWAAGGRWGPARTAPRLVISPAAACANQAASPLQLEVGARTRDAAVTIRPSNNFRVSEPDAVLRRCNRFGGEAVRAVVFAANPPVGPTPIGRSTASLVSAPALPAPAPLLQPLGRAAMLFSVLSTCNVLRQLPRAALLGARSSRALHVSLACSAEGAKPVPVAKPKPIPPVKRITKGKRSGAGRRRGPAVNRRSSAPAC